MPICCCSLAGTKACMHCSANGFAEQVSIWTNNSKKDSVDYEDVINHINITDTWEIPSFMLKEDSNDS